MIIIFTKEQMPETLLCYYSLVEESPRVNYQPYHLQSKKGFSKRQELLNFLV